MRLLLDQMVTTQMVTNLARAGHEAHFSREFLSNGAPDADVLALLDSHGFDALITLDKHGPQHPDDRVAALYAMSGGARIVQLRVDPTRTNVADQITTVLRHLPDIRELISPDSLDRRIRISLRPGVEKTDTLSDVVNEIGRVGGGD